VYAFGPYILAPGILAIALGSSNFRTPSLSWHLRNIDTSELRRLHNEFPVLWWLNLEDRLLGKHKD
jgi:hypothetical protein